jgi:DNA-binding MarR family transcriptional regulator
MNLNESLVVGRAYTTLSQQLGKLESLGLVAPRAGKSDHRVTAAVVTDKGQATSDPLDAARDPLAGIALAGWSAERLS